MLVEIDQEIAALPADDGDREAAIDALENLAVARREGKHLVVGKGTTLKCLAGWEGLSARSRGTFQQAASRAPEEMGLAQDLALRVLVRHSDTVPSISGPEGHRVISLPLSFFSDSRSVQRSRILAESLVDANWYIALGQYFGRESGFRGISVVLEPLLGGGGSTALVYADQQRAAGFCICIVDADRDCPSGALGSTARAVLNADDPGKPYTDVHIPNLRTAENLIPYGVLEAIAYSDIWARSGPIRAREEVAHFVEQLAQSSSPEIRLWIPLKLPAPVSYGKILEMGAAEATEEYWCGWARAVGSTCTILGTCREQGRCRNPGACTCEVLPTATGLLESAVEFVGGQSPQRLSEYLRADSTVEAEWRRIGLVTFSWGCSKSPSRT